jgi:hypothetical protein
VIFENAQKAWDYLRGKRAVYRQIPAPVLADLAVFCRAYQSCFDPNDRLHARAEGRRDVWLFIQKHLKLTDEQLYQVATGGPMPLPTEEDNNG